MSSSAHRYAAFLSYSHADAAFARWLHRRLERYALPRHLLKDRVRSARLGSVFRDREELPAAADLSETVREALGASAALIVVCSPNAAVSQWVGREIQLFRRLHPERPVLAAIASGEPPTCFPTALISNISGRALEPLAADLRPEKDGRRFGLLKLIAGLTGVGLDDLVQRDVQRRIRSVTAITVPAVFGMVAMSALAVLAVSARDEAERQRVEAEGLVEFMLTDLRDKLKAVGRLDVLTSANSRALAYYESQRVDRLPPASLERRARTLLAMGEDAERMGDASGALQKFSEAHRVTSEQLRRDPQNEQRILAHAQSEYWLGYMAYLEKDWPRAALHWNAYKALADQLVAADAGNAEWLREAGYAEGNLCTLKLANRSNPNAALGTCQRALERMQLVLDRRPGEKRSFQDLANRYAWLSDALTAAGKRTEAAGARTEQLRLLSSLALREPDDAELQDQWMRALMTMAEALEGNGDAEAGKRFRDQARSLAAKLVRHDPMNERWKKWQARIEKE